MRRLRAVERTAAALIERQRGPGRRLGDGRRRQLGRVAIHLQMENSFLRIGEGEAIRERRPCSCDQPVTRPVLAGDLHAPLPHERRSSASSASSCPGRRGSRTARAPRWPHAVFLHVAGDDAGERAAQVGGQLVRLAAVVQVERGHRLVAWERTAAGSPPGSSSDQLKKNESSVARRYSRTFDALGHFARRLRRIADDDLVALRSPPRPGSGAENWSICSKYGGRRSGR